MTDILGHQINGVIPEIVGVGSYKCLKCGCYIRKPYNLNESRLYYDGFCSYNTELKRCQTEKFTFDHQTIGHNFRFIQLGGSKNLSLYGCVVCGVLIWFDDRSGAFTGRATDQWENISKTY